MVVPGLTDQQRAAVEARGNVLVVAGAGTGKTSTLVARCLDVLLRERVTLDRVLMVTFTDAAAAEMRQRIRLALDERLRACETAPQAGEPTPSPSGGGEQQKQVPDDEFLREQIALLDTAHVSTLHSFCLHLVREHFHELGIDPQISVLDEKQSLPLMDTVLTKLLAGYYEGESATARGVQALAQKLGAGMKLRELILKLHRYSQSLADPEGWLEEQVRQFNQSEPVKWREWFPEAVLEWRADWRERLETHASERKAAMCLALLKKLSTAPAPADCAKVLEEILATHQSVTWADGERGRKVFDRFFKEAGFLHSLVASTKGADPMQEDWDWMRRDMVALLEAAREFTEAFTRAKRDQGGVDFADVEQLSLRLLLTKDGKPSETAEHWRQQFDYVFVDEYQDINGAQDAILTALSREGKAANRFLVGDVKQSIYRFRLAAPGIFRAYEERWRKHSGEGKRLPLAENFRSREAILQVVNSLFSSLMRESLGGLVYDADAQLRFGKAEERQALSVAPGEADVIGGGEGRRAGLDHPSPSVPPPVEGRGKHGSRVEGGEPFPRVELHLIRRPEADEGKGGEPDDDEAGKAVAEREASEKEAWLVANRLKELKNSGHRIWDKEKKCFRAVEWGDMAVLLRSPKPKVETFAREFAHAGVPLLAERGGFFTAIEVTDLLNLLRILDNPLQDIPLLAVLRSPLVGLSVEELVEIRVWGKAAGFWGALQKFQREFQTPDLWAGGAGILAWRKADWFLRSYHAWREMAQKTALSHCLERVLLDTHYEALLQAEPRGAMKLANVRRLLELARQYDPYQRQGLFRFLQFVTTQEDAELDHEPALVQTENAVRLLSIHRSKGLEFPVVALADLGKQFNFGSAHEDILLNEEYGLCAKVMPPELEVRYPSLPHWLAQRAETRELAGEELRLFYVAVTRARDTLILSGVAKNKPAGERWPSLGPMALSDAQVSGAKRYLEWLRLWLPMVTADKDWTSDDEGANALLRWKIYDANDPLLARALHSGVVAEPAPEELKAMSSETVEALKQRLAWKYTRIAATVEPAKASVTGLRERRVELADEEAQPWFAFAAEKAEGDQTGDTGVSAEEKGSFHHVFLQFVSLDSVASVEALQAEAARLVGEGLMRAEETAVLDWEGLLEFWNSVPGRRIRAKARGVRHELPFTVRVSGGDLKRAGIAPVDQRLPDDEFIVVQGVADLAVILNQEIWLLDFKTDDIAPGELPRRMKHYEPQLRLYALALERIFRRPVTERWLHFLKLRRTLSVEATVN
ncbi:MAG: UvrD-helicase domain-containing protein [Verrucomicrobiota bacterium]